MAFTEAYFGFGLPPPNLLAVGTTGTAVASSLHMVAGSLVIAGNATGTITLTGTAPFTSATSYAILVSSNDTATGVTHQPYPFNQTFNSFQIANQDSVPHTYQYVCIGT